MLAEKILTVIDYILSFVRGFVLPSRLGGRKPGFVASGSVTVPITERRPGQSPLWRRIRVIFFDRLVWVHALFIFACVLGVILNLVRCFDPSAQVRSAYGPVVVKPGRQRWEYLLTRIGWPPIFWLAQVISCWIPIAYTIWPPRAVTADEALVLDEKTKVKYPKPECWDPKRGRIPGRISDHLSTAIFLYTIICFAGSWFVADV